MIRRVTQGERVETSHFEEESEEDFLEWAKRINQMLTSLEKHAENSSESIY